MYSYIFNEAVFIHGKETLQPLEEILSKLQVELKKIIKNSPHDPSKIVATFYKNPLWKEMELNTEEIFGFKSVTFVPLNDGTLSDTGTPNDLFNAQVVHNKRFPVDGLVTDKGFYDKTHSISAQIYIGIWYILNLTPGEILAYILHEIGHCLDPAIVNINYGGTNYLIEYFTNRRDAVNNKNEKELTAFQTFINIIKDYISMKTFNPYGILRNLWSGIQRFFMGKDNYNEMMEKKFKEKIEEIISNKGKQNYMNDEEYFADNIARMYGYGPEFMSASLKSEKYFDSQLTDSWCNKEIRRQKIVMLIIISTLNSEHGTDIERGRSLIEEYDKDINNKHTPPEVKKQLIKDRDSVIKLIDKFSNEFSDFQNRCNQMVSSAVNEFYKE